MQQQTPLGVAFGHLAERRGDHPAVTDDERTISFAELESAANRLARELAARGTGVGSLVSIALPNTVGFFTATVAAWKLGAIPQPLSHRLPDAELAAVIEVADPSVVIGKNPGTAREWLPVDFEPDPALSDAPLPPVTPPAWKAPTSGGSTGRPKIIVAGEPGTTEDLVSRTSRMRLEPDEVFLSPAPLYHNAPFLYSALALLCGNHVLVTGRFDESRTLELVERYRVNWLYLVPTMMSRILRLPDAERLGRDLSSLHTVFHLAAPCPPKVKRAWIEWLGAERIFELYAGTEAQAITTITGPEWLAHPGSVGTVKVGEMRILDEAGNELPPGEIGEVWMRPDPGVVTYRYIGAEARSRDGWETLGDMGSFDADGYLYLADRSADMILVGGSNVYPAEVEAALLEHPAVISAAVIGLPDEDYGNVVHAIVQPDGEVTDDDLRTHLSRLLVGYKIPRSFERSTEPLRDDAGKVRRFALRSARTR